MSSELTRQLSSSLFESLRSHCVLLSDLATQVDSRNQDVVHGLLQLSTTLETHYKNNCGDDYVISPKLADYVFFPLTNLLKRPSLPDNAIRYILQVLAFLVQHSWSHDLEESLLDQLFTLVVFLSKGSASNSNSDALLQKDSSFLLAVTDCLLAIQHSIPRNYFSGKDVTKRLSLLGDSTTILLDILESLGVDTEEQARSILKGIAWLFSTRVTADQVSLVFPGIISKVIKYHTKVKNLHSETLVEILSTLKILTIKVFGDDSLSITLIDKTPKPIELSDISSFFEHGYTAAPLKEDLGSFPIDVSLNAEPGQHRTSSWLAATSKQLKISVLIFMKELILQPSSRVRVANNHIVVDAIIDFVSAITKSCFESLFKEVIPSTFDILSAAMFVFCENKHHSAETDFLRRASRIYVLQSRPHIDLLHKMLILKTDDLVQSQLSNILFSLNEEKIGLCLTALKLHLHIIKSLESITLKIHSESEQIVKTAMKIMVTSISKASIINSRESKTRPSKKDLIGLLSGTSHEESSSNTLDDIKLPPHIDTKKLTSMKKKYIYSYVPTVSLQSIDISHDDEGDATYSIRAFDTAYTRSSEANLRHFAEFLGQIGEVSIEEMISSIFEFEIDHKSAALKISQQAASLWLSNSILKGYVESGNRESNFDIDEYLAFEDNDEPKVDALEETCYLLLQSAQDMLIEAKSIFANTAFNAQSLEYELGEKSYAIALESFGILANQMSKENFQTDVLMDYLYPLFEALTYPSSSQLHTQAKASLKAIVTTHYKGSLEQLVYENADYLIDSLSINLATSSGLTPSLPGILLVVIKISGLKLFSSNHLQDILSQIFIVIDSYHGYSLLVENFFHVFEGIIMKVEESYSKEISHMMLLSQGDETSLYKPWGMKTRREMLNLINDASRNVDPFADYDPGKEYFHRKQDVPFSELEDSDDEEEAVLDQTTSSDEEDKWPSPIPKNVYTSVQQIFTYGLQLLSHPSIKLRILVLRTLTRSYTLMSTNNKIVVQIMAQYWPLLLVLATGSSTMSESNAEEDESQLEQLMVPAIEFMTTIFEEDKRHERFMASRFVDMWNFMKKKSRLISRALNEHGAGRTQALSLKYSNERKACLAYSKMFISGINIYERMVPDLIAHEMLQVCLVFGIDKGQNFSKEVENHLWVLKNFKA